MHLRGRGPGQLLAGLWVSKPMPESPANEAIVVQFVCRFRCLATFYRVAGFAGGYRWNDETHLVNRVCLINSDQSRTRGSVDTVQFLLLKPADHMRGTPCLSLNRIGAWASYLNNQTLLIARPMCVMWDHTINVSNWQARMWQAIAAFIISSPLPTMAGTGCIREVPPKRVRRRRICLTVLVVSAKKDKRSPNHLERPNVQVHLGTADCITARWRRKLSEALDLGSRSEGTASGWEVRSTLDPLREDRWAGAQGHRGSIHEEKRHE